MRKFIPEQTFLLLHVVVDQVLLTKGEDGFSVLLPNGASCPWDHGIPDMDPADMAEEAYTGVGEEGGVLLVCFYTGRKDISQKIPYGGCPNELFHHEDCVSAESETNSLGHCMYIFKNTFTKNDFFFSGTQPVAARWI